MRFSTSAIHLAFEPEGFRFRLDHVPGINPVVIYASTNLADWTTDPGDGSLFTIQSRQHNGDGTETVSARLRCFIWSSTTACICFNLLRLHISATINAAVAVFDFIACYSHLPIGVPGATTVTPLA
ncbi:MAG: hypothetical protein HC802_11985 [Caldilineaceae bacterium]|nr:hypothetical protein [Caldilineaceae bacterium]